MGPMTSERRRVEAGELLAFLDWAGGRVAWHFFTGVRDDGPLRASMKNTISTVAFNAFTFSKPVYMGDLVHLDGRIVHAGASSIGVHMTVSRQSWDCPEMVQICSCVVTMVSIDLKTLKAVRGHVPAILLEDPEDLLLHKQYTAARARQSANDALVKQAPTEVVDPSAIETAVNRAKCRKVSIASTCSFGTREYLEKFKNSNGTIFGGEVLRWMARHASHCARVFTRSPHVYMIGMHDMLFDCPVFPTEFGALESKVVFVTNTTLQVDVKLQVLRGGSLSRSHQASFVYILLDENEKKREIMCGLDLSNETQENLHLYRNARNHYEVHVLARRR